VVVRMMSHENTHSSRGRMKRWISFAVAAFALNFAWEMAQMTAYAAMRGRPLEATLLPCARAAGGDLVITAFVAAPFVVVLRRGHRAWPWAGMALTGALVALAIERLAVPAGRWAYGPAMPTVPLVDVGLWPLFQMMALPPLVAWLSGVGRPVD